MTFDPRAAARRAALAEKAESAWKGGTLGDRPDAARVRDHIETVVKLGGGLTWAEVWAEAGEPSADWDESFGRVAAVLDGRAQR